MQINEAAYKKLTADSVCKELAEIQMQLVALTGWLNSHGLKDESAHLYSCERAISPVLHSIRKKKSVRYVFPDLQSFVWEMEYALNALRDSGSSDGLYRECKARVHDAVSQGIVPDHIHVCVRFTGPDGRVTHGVREVPSAEHPQEVYWAARQILESRGIFTW